MAVKYIRFLDAEEAPALPDGQAVMPAVAVDAGGAAVDVGGGYTLPAATTGAIGGVKMAAHVASAAGESVTAAEFEALLDALEAAGIVAAS